MDAAPVTFEVHLANGLPNFTIVGLPETEVKESKDRVRAALQNCQVDFPARRITVNLAPADLPKESGHFDLPIALGILAASGQIPSDKLAGRDALTRPYSRYAACRSALSRHARGEVPDAMQTCAGNRRDRRAQRADLGSSVVSSVSHLFFSSCVHL